jgi:hypothetical protein
LVLCIDGIEQPHTLVAKKDDVNQLICGTIITTTVPNSVLTVRNPSKGISTLRLTANDGGHLGTSQHLVIISL